MDTPQKNEEQKLAEWQIQEQAQMERARKFLRDLCSYDNKNLTVYAQMRGVSTDASELSTQYSSNWGATIGSVNADVHEDWRDVQERKKQDFEFLKKTLEGGILIDLGSGGGMVSAVRSSFDLEADIGVEKFTGGNKPMDALEPLWASSVNYSGKGSKFHIDIKDDMLDFTARVQHNSSHFMLNGIDLHILPNSDYRMALAAEMMRATKEGGIVFGIGSLDWLERCFSQIEDKYQMVRRRVELPNLRYLFVKTRIEGRKKQTIDSKV